MNHNNQSHHIHLNIAKQGKYCKILYKRLRLKMAHRAVVGCAELKKTRDC